MLRRVIRATPAPRPALLCLQSRQFTQNTQAAVTAALSKGLFNAKAVEKAVAEFSAMGFDKSYEAHFTPAEISAHVKGYMNALASRPSADAPLMYASETPEGAFYITGRGSNEFKLAKPLDTYIQNNLPKNGTHSVSVKSYSPTNESGVTLTTVNFFPFKNPNKHSNDLAEITTQHFLDVRSVEARKRYGDLIERMGASFHQQYDIQQAPDGSLMLTLAIEPDRAVYFTLLTSLIGRIPNLTISKRFLETFSNGAQIYTFYTKGSTVAELERAALLINQLPNRPRNVLTKLHSEGALTPNEVIYGYSATMFAYYYTPPTVSDDYKELTAALTDATQLKRLKSLRSSMFQEMLSESFITELISGNVALFKEIYADFERGSTPESRAALLSTIEKLKLAPAEDSFFRTVVNFNKAVLKTNFFKVKKAAVAYRLDPSFIGGLDFPRVPYGIFMVVGSRFRGFHVRFHDIARGGIRMVLSANENVYKKNKRTLFQENYNLAFTQMLKNKDIPESGSKGIILVSTRMNETDKTVQELAKKNIFLQYIDAMLDVMLPGVEGVRDNLGSTEVLFFGPDENTAGEYPIFAAYLSRDRGYKQWKSLTTGKGAVVGGVPHDTYGMTTRSVRQYVTGMYRKLGLTESSLTKFVTGGPDGDLGSNEIKMGTEKIVAICDGEASVHDPAGIDREELLRLAEARATLKHFNAAKLTKAGFRVLVSDANVTLPDGTVVEDGRAFRDSFHFSKYSKADVFVPCGGRPASVTLETVHKFLLDSPDATGENMLKGARTVAVEKLKYKYIVEGANLFITQDARLALEAVGVHLFKDSSANKGGVTSSSVEVFTGLALDDATHKRVMCQQADGSVPAFYQTMVQQIAARIEDNARREFEIIWHDSQAGYLGGSKTLISDALSRKIVEIREFIASSDLHKDTKLFRYVLEKYTPPALLAEVGLDTIMKNVPHNYLCAIFNMSIASEFVYTAGMKANEFSFFQYMHNLYAAANKGTH